MFSIVFLVGLEAVDVGIYLQKPYLIMLVAVFSYVFDG